MATVNNGVWGKVKNTYTWGGTGDSIPNLVKSNKLVLNTQYDTSIAVCNLGNAPKIRTIYFPINWESGYDIVYQLRNGECQMAYFSNASSTYTYNPLTLKNANMPKPLNEKDFPTGAEDQWMPSATKYSSASPVLQLDPYRICLLPVITALSVNPSGRGKSEDLSSYTITDIDLDTYFNQYAESHPYILNVFCKVYLNIQQSTTGVRVSNSTLPFKPCPIGNVQCKDTTFLRGLGVPMSNAQYYPLFGIADVLLGSAQCYSFTNAVTASGNLNYTWFNKPTIWGNDNEITIVPTAEATGDPESDWVFIRCVCHVNKNRIITAAASTYGLPIATNVNAASNGTWDDPDVHLPVMDKNGIIKDTTSGNGNKENPYYNNQGNNNGLWDNGVPAKKDDPNNYTNKIDLNIPKLTTTGIFNRTFAMTSTGVKSLSNYLWNADETIFNEIVKGLSLMGGNPIDGLVDLRLYPFNIVNKSTGGASKSIVVGRTDTGVTGIEITNYNAVLDLGKCTFYPYFGNFLDYEPFTTASLYIPYVGIVPISTADFMGQTISCKMVVDITTGSCTAIVFANAIPIIYKNGNIGVEIPMTGTNSAEYASRIMGGLTSGSTDVALGAASKSVGQVVSGVGSIVDSALSVNNTMYNTAGSSSPACGIWQPQNCYFIIQRPVPIVPENYGHTVGYACNYQSKISDCSGYTQTYNVDVSSINAPESEKNAIAEILNSGFYA